MGEIEPRRNTKKLFMRCPQIIVVVTVGIGISKSGVNIISFTWMFCDLEQINFSKPLSIITYKIGLKIELNLRTLIKLLWASLVAQTVKNFARNAGDPGSIPGWGRSPGEGNGYPLQYSCWRTPLMEEPGWLHYMVSQRIRHDWATKTFTFIFIYYKSM